MTQNPLNFTQRDYLGLRDQLTAFVQNRIPEWTPDASDFAYVLLEAMSYMGDMMSYYVDIAAQESNILSANSAANVFAHAELYGYQPGLAQSAQVELLLNKSDSYVLPDGSTFSELTVSAGSRAYDATTGLIFETVEDVVVGDEPVTVLARQGTTRTVTVGVSNGGAGQRMTVPLDSGTYLDGTKNITYAVINGTQWIPTTSLLDHGPNDAVFAVMTDPLGNSAILFGDGISGAIPPVNSEVRLTYRQCDGAFGNSVNAYGVTQWLADYTATDALFSGVTVTNPSRPVGGVDVESIDNVRAQAVKFAKAQRRAVSTNDFARVLRASGDVLTAWADSRVWSRPIIWVMPRDPLVLTETDPTRRNELISTLERQVSSLAMAGMSPTVLMGHVATVNVQVEIRVWDPIDLRTAALLVRSAILSNFAYDDIDFERDITEDYILRIIRDNVDDNIVRFARVNNISGDPSQVTGLGTYPGVGVEYTPTEVQAVRPQAGNVLVVDDQSLEIVVIGTGEIYIDRVQEA